MTWINADGLEIDFRTHDRRVKINDRRADNPKILGFLRFLIVGFSFSLHRRYFQLLNGSMLITNANAMVDNKRFNCTAFNGYVAKPRRMYAPFLHVLPSIDSNEAQQPELLPPLQNKTVTIGIGQTLRLLCATTANAKASAIEWRFTPSTATSSANARTILLETPNRIELKIANVTPEANGGIYNCSYAGEFQVSVRIHIRLYLLKSRGARAARLDQHI